MLTYELHQRVRRPAGRVFDFVGTHYFDNHPRWEREVVSVCKLTEGPIGVGTQGVMVRQEYGRRTETRVEVTSFEPPGKIAFRHVGGSMKPQIAFVATPEDEASTDLGVHVRAQLEGPYRLLTPLFAFNLPRIGERIMRRLAELIEAAHGPSQAHAGTVEL